MTQYYTFVSHLLGPIILQTGQSFCGYCVTRYHIVCLIHWDPSFYKIEQRPLSHEESTTRTNLHKIQHYRKTMYVGGEAHLRLGEVYLRLGEVESIFKIASGSPRRTYLRLGEAEPTIIGQLHKRKSILSLISLFYMKIYM